MRQLTLILVAIFISGCVSWGHADILAYDAAARKEISYSIAAKADELDREVVDSLPEPQQNLARSKIEAIRYHADDNYERADFMLNYFGKDKVNEPVELGSETDRKMRSAAAGIAHEAESKREFKSNFINKAGKAVGNAVTSVIGGVWGMLPIWLKLAIAILILTNLASFGYGAWVRLAISRTKRQAAKYAAASREAIQAFNTLPKDTRKRATQDRPNLGLVFEEEKLNQKAKIAKIAEIQKEEKDDA